MLYEGHRYTRYCTPQYRQRHTTASSYCNTLKTVAITVPSPVKHKQQEQPTGYFEVYGSVLALQCIVLGIISAVAGLVANWSSSSLYRRIAWLMRCCIRSTRYCNISHRSARVFQIAMGPWKIFQKLNVLVMSSFCLVWYWYSTGEETARSTMKLESAMFGSVLLELRGGQS